MPGPGLQFCLYSKGLVNTFLVCLLELGILHPVLSVAGLERAVYWPCRKEARTRARVLGALAPYPSDTVCADFMSHFLLKNNELRVLSNVSKSLITFLVVTDSGLGSQLGWNSDLGLLR